MLIKKPAKDGKTCKVTFELPAEVEAKTAYLCGEFTKWEKNGVRMTHHKDGRFSTTVTLKVGKEYHFRYLLDGERWENDWQADAYAPNEFGSEDSIARV